MIYRNTKTGVIFDSPCIISGGDWVVEEKAAPVKPDETEEVVVEVEEPEESEEIDFESMTIAELRDYAEEHGIDLGDAKKKDDIVAVLSSTK